MADDQAQCAAADDDHDEVTPGYKAPAQKSLKEIQELDKDDEALVKYKEQLLGGAGDAKPVFPDNPNRVIVTKMMFCPVGRDEMVLDLTNIDKDKPHTFVVKEGVKYRLKVEFYVQRDVVSGLRYFHAVYRKGIKVDKENFMVGSYGPKETPHLYTSPEDEAPSGMLSRGSYKVKSKFTDDDKNSILEWEWKLEIKSDWA